jgi:integrase
LDIPTLRDFEKYLANEYDLFKQGKLEKVIEETIDEDHPARITEARGKHTITGIMKRFRSFIRWANGINKQDKPDRIFTTNNPFAQYPIGDSSNEQDYTTPYFITVNEIKKLQKTELPSALAVQRDIFVFHCLIGCRVSDLLSLTKSNIVDGFVQYIPRKTKEQRPVVVSVPLNDTALNILEKYKDLPGDKLLPFISDQKYNKAIKKIFTSAKLTRLVTVIDSKTGETIQRPLNELASSHMARRTFVGNLYNKVPDPNIIGSMTGHKEGSRAFLRYRSIGDKTKKKLVSYLD